VSSEAVILIDSTVDNTALEELGFHHVIQKTLDCVSVDDRQCNCNIVNYLRQTVSKVFQKNLSVLSMATIQQFLDELVWRESHGLSDADAFCNIIRDLSAQTRVDYGMSLIKRLSAVAADPFKDWSIKTDQIAPRVLAVGSFGTTIPIQLTSTATIGKIKHQMLSSKQIRVYFSKILIFLSLGQAEEYKLLLFVNPDSN